MGYDLGSITT